ncbi:hypothetical protein [Acinetobacter ursingii]|uniref:hypothetical protein n=1 Tax=Acinetobacter ursingii TaxID=108980 RepID=UPI00124FC36A|nr:hypothetical protein [Acinetobacter ursingii]
MIIVSIETAKNAGGGYLVSLSVNQKVKYTRYSAGRCAGEAAAVAVRVAMSQKGNYCILAPIEVLNLIPESVRSGRAN